MQARRTLVFEVALLLLSWLFHRCGLILLTMGTCYSVRYRVNGLRFVQRDGRVDTETSLVFSAVLVVLNFRQKVRVDGHRHIWQP